MTGDELTGDELTGDELTGDELTGDELDSSPDPSDVETRDAILEQVDLNPPTRLSWCPNCGEPVGSVTSRGLLDHTAGPCGCSLTPGQVKRL